MWRFCRSNIHFTLGLCSLFSMYCNTLDISSCLGPLTQPPLSLVLFIVHWFSIRHWIWDPQSCREWNRLMEHYILKLPCSAINVFLIEPFCGYSCPFLVKHLTSCIPAIGGVLFVFVVISLFQTSFTDPGILPRATPEEAADIEKQIGEGAHIFTCPWLCSERIEYRLDVTF